MTEQNINNRKPIIFVKVPFGHGFHKFKIMKRLNWGAVDHLILQTLAVESLTSNQLSEKTLLPKQLITEIIIPLMKAGWVEILSTKQDYQFQVTQRGLAAATQIDLPVNKEPLIRTRNFIVDPITQQCYRVDRKKRQTYQIYPKGKADRLLSQYGNFSTTLQTEKPVFEPDISDILSCVANDDEDVHGFESDTVKRSYADNIRYTIARVDENNCITGVPEISNELREEIISAANTQREFIKLIGGIADSSITHTVHKIYSLEKAFTPATIQNHNIKIIAKPDEHKSHFLSEINNSRSRLIIHSTFITESCLRDVLENLVEAARRSVRIDIMWGQTPPESEDKLATYKLTSDSISKIQNEIGMLGLGTQFRIHRQPTNSHAKFIISDTAEDNWRVTIGSCNWLSSNFNRFESSACITDNIIASQFFDICSSLAIGSKGLANPLSRDFAVQSARLKNSPTALESEKHDKNTIEVKLLTASDHHTLAKSACKNAKEEILVCSHRVSYAGDRPIFTPLKAAKRSTPSISIKVCYGRSSMPMTTQESKRLENELEEDGFEMFRANNPQVHAKFLTWDSHDLIVASLNWLSASSRGDQLSEIGIHLHGGDFSTRIRESFNSFHNIN